MPIAKIQINSQTINPIAPITVPAIAIPLPEL